LKPRKIVNVVPAKSLGRSCARGSAVR
jgi:hypothetical protein